MAHPTTPRVPWDTPMYEDPPHNKKMSRTWVIFLERLGNKYYTDGVTGDTEYKATFVLLRELTVANDLTDVHYIAKKAGRFKAIYANGKVPARGAEARIRIYKKPYAQLGDPPTIFENIFPDGEEEEGYISLPDADALGQAADEAAAHVVSWEHTDAMPLFKSGEDGEIQPGDLLRIDCSQIGSEYPGKGYTIVLHWEPL